VQTLERRVATPCCSRLGSGPGPRRCGVKLDFVRLGKFVENGHIESYSGRLRDECPNVVQFMPLGDAWAKIETRCVNCNLRRPRSSLVHLTTSEFVRNRQENRARESAEL